MAVPPDPEGQRLIEAELAPGERLLWLGRPAQGLRLRGSDIFMIPFSLMWGGFAIVWEASAIGLSVFGNGEPNRGAGPFFVLWGIPFVAIGLYMIVGRFFWDAWQRKRTVYGIGARHVVIRRGGSLTMLDLATLPPMQLSSGRSARGTLSFGANSAPFGFAAPSGWPGAGRYQPPAFELIEQAREVMRIVSDAQQALRQAGLTKRCD
jgi:hypothetical protein